MERLWIARVGTAWSQFWNAVWCGNPDQSFSSRTYEAKLLGKKWALIAEPLINALFKIIFRQDNHCEESYNSDDERTYQM